MKTKRKEGMEKYLTWITFGRLTFFYVIELPALNEGRAIQLAWEDWCDA